MSFAKSLKSLGRRTTALSKTDFVVTIVAWISKAYVAGFTLWMGASKYGTWSTPGKLAFVLFVAALLVATVQPFFKKHTSKKWVEEDARRTKVTATAISELTHALQNGTLDSTTVHKLQQSLLSNIKSEVESITVDRESIYFNVTLLLPEPAEAKVREVCRAHHDRELRSYWKRELKMWRELETRASYYEPNSDANDGGQKSAFGMRLVLLPEKGQAFPLGFVRIENSEADFCDGQEMEAEIEARTLLYMSLLKLVMIADSKLRPTGRN